MILDRSVPGKHAKAVFFREQNDIDIYIEDTAKGSKKLFAEILSRAVKGKYKINDVFPLGDKQTVIERCKSEQNNRDRLRLYIVDGDLALLNDCNPKGIERLYVLKRYCIENYLMDENAIVEVLREEDLEKSASHIKNQLEFTKWVQKNEPLLCDLFVVYAITQTVCPSCLTVAFPINRLVSSDEGFIDESKVVSRLEQVKQTILNKISEAEFKAKKRFVVSNTEKSTDGKLRFISGKDYLLPLILLRMKKITKFRAENSVIKQRLALKCDLAEIEDVVSHIA